jgi:hypothetical protein
MTEEAAIVARLGDLVAARFGAPAQHLSTEPIRHTRANVAAAIRTRRAYNHHIFLVDSREVHLFEKRAIRQVSRQLDSYLNSMAVKGLKVPWFYGTFRCNSLHVAAWEYQPPSPHVAPSHEDLKRAIRVVAAFNSWPIVHPEFASGIDVPTEVRPLQARPLLKLPESSEQQEWVALGEKTKLVFTQSDLFQRRLDSVGAGFLSHNDVNLRGGHNVDLHSPSGDIVIYDWEGASLSAPGADLNTLFRSISVDAQFELADVYSQQLLAFGIKVAPPDIVECANIIGAFRWLGKGWKKQEKSIITKSLDYLLPYAEELSRS